MVHQSSVPNWDEHISSYFPRKSHATKRPEIYWEVTKHYYHIDNKNSHHCSLWHVRHIVTCFNVSFIHKKSMEAASSQSLLYRWGNRGAERLVWQIRLKLLHHPILTTSYQFPHAHLSLCSSYYCVCGDESTGAHVHGTRMNMQGQLWGVSSFLPSVVPGTELRLSSCPQRAITHQAIPVSPIIS